MRGRYRDLWQTSGSPAGNTRRAPFCALNGACSRVAPAIPERLGQNCVPPGHLAVYYGPWLRVKLAGNLDSLEKECMAAADYRLGLDLGTNSIGWCAVQLDEAGNPSGVLGAGVRILTPNEEAGRDPQSKATLAATRRAARSARRRRDRFVRRRARLVQVLVNAGLLPEDRKSAARLHRLDPYWLRAAALDQRLEPYEIGRALFHLNQRRGFKSNRVTDVGDDEKGAVRAGATALEAKLVVDQARTLGELLARLNGRDKLGRRLKGTDSARAPRSVRFRPSTQGARNSTPASSRSGQFVSDPAPKAPGTPTTSTRRGR